MFFVNYLASKDEKNDLLKTFKSLDLNGDGKLSREELIIGFNKICSDPEEAKEKVEHIMK